MRSLVPLILLLSFAWIVGLILELWLVVGSATFGLGWCVGYRMRGRDDKAHFAELQRLRDQVTEGKIGSSCGSSNGA